MVTHRVHCDQDLERCAHIRQVRWSRSAGEGARAAVAAGRPGGNDAAERRLSDLERQTGRSARATPRPTCDDNCE